MVIEVLGSRLIGPFFGVSLFVWTSLIAVTLIALAMGYWLGGILADRHESADWLYGIILLSGLLTLLVPLLKAPVLTASLELGLRAGSFVSTLLLFGPALLALGCVSPYVVRLAVRELNAVGRTVGAFYALSTVGSVIGTLATGFFLIAYLGVDRIFQLVAVLLIGLAIVYFALFRRRRWLAVVLVAPMLADGYTAPDELRMDDGTLVRQVAAEHSYYGSLKVVEYSFGAQRTRELIIDGLVQGGLDPDSGQSVYEYSYLLSWIPYALNPEGRRGLVIGLGAGVIPAWYDRRGIPVDVVDIDPLVVRFATDYFDYQPGGEVFIEDARYFLGQTSQRYDYIVLDVFTGDTTPGHLLSQEAMTLLARRLTPGGVLGVNLVGRLQGNTYMTASVVDTLASRFDQVHILPTFDPRVEDASGNLLLFAYQGETRQPRLDFVDWTSVHPLIRKEVVTSLGRRFAFPEGTPGIILKDDYNPIDFFDADLKEQVRRSILESTRWELLLDQG